MVLFQNIKLQQRTHVRHQGRIIPATVRYKGHLNNQGGEWVGVELDYAYGKHNGTWRGWRYFSCPENCGLFTHASNIRFIKTKRTKYDNYRRVNTDSEVDETLFYTETPPVHSKWEPKSVDWEYIRRARTAFEDPPVTFKFGLSRERRFPLSHAVGNSIPARTMLNPETAMKPFQYYSEPVHREYATSCDFNPLPTMPHYTMPHQALLRQMRRKGRWEDYGLKQPRFSTV